MNCATSRQFLFFIPRRRRSDSPKSEHPGQLTRLSSHSSALPSGLFSTEDFGNLLSNGFIRSDYDDLFQSIKVHVRTYYTMDFCEPVLKGKVEPTTAGFHLPTHTIVSLLNHPQTREGALVMCISWAILSRCLLLKFGVNNSPGSTFLPPEIVECFQSFSFRQIMREGKFHERSQLEWAMFSHWKQISAALMHSTYVTNGFLYIDSRTANLERALIDLDPLLRTFSNSAGESSRVVDLREIFKKGARFAFLLYGQPYIWQFDWESNQSEGGATDSLNIQGEEAQASTDIDKPTPRPTKIVIWPALLRVLDGMGQEIKDGEKEVCGAKYISCWYTAVPR